MVKTNTFVTIETRPIVTWPGPMTPPHERQKARYGAGATRTRRELIRELDLIGAEDCFIQAAYRDDQIRLDGLPRAGAKPEHPGIIVTYTGKDGATYELPCDTFQDAEQNLRAIVVTLQRLRLIEETGASVHMADSIRASNGWRTPVSGGWRTPVSPKKPSEKPSSNAPKLGPPLPAIFILTPVGTPPNSPNSTKHGEFSRNTMLQGDRDDVHL